MININKLKYLFVLLAFFGCDSKLDIEPQQSIDQDLALNTSENVMAVLVGAYDALGDDDVYGGEILLQTDLLASTDELTWVGTFESPREVFNKIINAVNSQIEVTWSESYETINIVNNVLGALDVVDEDLKARAEGEARFIRGTVYFELVRLYARAWNDGDPNSNMGLPIILEPTRAIDVSDFKGRSSVAEVYNEVILPDLLAAQQLLPEENGFFANTYVASAMLSRVYLMQGKYAEAAEAASRVIESGNYSLNEDFADAFNQSANTPEDVFAIQVTIQDGTNIPNTFYAAPIFSGRGDIIINPPHFALYEEGDERATLFYENEGDVFTGKWTNIAGNVNIIRLAEMYLTRAEANFREGSAIGDTPLNDINTIRGRAGLAPLSQGDLNLEAILLERKLELSFEGHFIHDIKRTEGTVGALPYNSPRLIFPIPQRELDANPAIRDQQNPG